MRFRVDPASRVPIYEQIKSQVRDRLARGSLRPGEKLPSVRELSRELVVNPNTIARAYAEAEREGLVNTRQGRGVFAAEPRFELSAAARKRRIGELLDELLALAVNLGCSEAELLELVNDRVKKFRWRGNPAGKETRDAKAK